MTRFEQLVKEIEKERSILPKQRDELLAKRQELLEKQKEAQEKVDKSINKGNTDIYLQARQQLKDILSQIEDVTADLNYLEQKIKEINDNGKSEVRQKLLAILRDEEAEYKPKILGNIKTLKTHLKACLDEFEKIQHIRTGKQTEIAAAYNKLIPYLEKDRDMLRNLLEIFNSPHVPDIKDELAKCYEYGHFKNGIYKDL